MKDLKDLTEFWRETGWSAATEAQGIRGWIRDYFEQHRLEYAVLGLSGGLDSSVVASILVNALGGEKVIGVLLPDGDVTDPKDVEDATHLADKLGIRTKKYDISSLISAFVQQDPEIADRGPGGVYRNGVQYGNLKARVRMIKLYEVSQLMPGRSVVVGTTDRSEWFMGYFTKYGDGGVDLEPILNVYKTQVRELARELDLPRGIISKRSSPNLVPGMTAEKELGFSYEELDLILATVVDGIGKKMSLQSSKEVLSDSYGIDTIIVDKVLEKISGTAHKRQIPPSPPKI
ncbi:MAG: NAD+ synthase [Candidatus Bathyarchaeia archaeon]|jgi:NAD+ synthase